MTRRALGLALVAAMTAAACLQKETTSTIYLRRDGSFDWVVLERNVRSDADVDASRTAEEQTWARDTTLAQSALVRTMLDMGGRDVFVRWLRSTRPYAVETGAKFDSLPAAFDRALAGCALPYANGIADTDGVTTWTFRLDVGPDGSRLDAAGHVCSEGLAGLGDLLSGLTVVLESGAFTGAQGFTLEGGDSAAIDDDAIDASVKATGLVELSLSWK